MFSIRKLKEKSKPKEKHWKKHYEVDNLETEIHDTQKSYLSVDVDTGLSNIDQDEDGLKVKKNIKKTGLTWRYFNQISDQADGSQEDDLHKEVMPLSISEIDSSETRKLALHETLHQFHNTKLTKFKKLKRKLSNKEKKKDNALLKKKKSLHNKEVHEMNSSVTAISVGIGQSEEITHTNLGAVGNSEGKKTKIKVKKIKEKLSKKKKKKNSFTEDVRTVSTEEISNPFNVTLETQTDVCINLDSTSDFETENETQNSLAMPNINSSKYLTLTKQKNKLTIPVVVKEGYIDITSSTENNLLVALYPGTKIYVSGNFCLKLVLGSVSVLGYIFKEGENRAVFSPPTHSILAINVLVGVNIRKTPEDQLHKLEIPVDWVKNLNMSEDTPVTIVNFSRYDSNMTHILKECCVMQKALEKQTPSFDSRWKNILGVNFIDNPQNTMLNLLKEGDEWNNITKSIPKWTKKNKRTCILVCGGKGVGKSTFLKFILNSFLNFNAAEVACLDLDPGQPEFYVPSTLSLVKFSDPLLGPSYSHGENLNFTFQRHVLLGDISVNNVLQEYLAVVKSLVANIKSFKSTVPVVVNTMGFTSNFGFDIMIDLLRMIQPTQVITIESRVKTANFPYQLKPDLLNSMKRGVVTSFWTINLDHNLTIVRSQFSGRSAILSRELRDISILSYLSKLWNDNEENMIGDTCKEPMRVSYSKIAIYIHGAFVPYNHVFQAINASLVALCHVNEKYLEVIKDNFPLKVQDDSPWLLTNQCLGWGVVRGIDPVAREIHILTRLNKDISFNDVNLLVMPNVHLPNQFYEYFNGEEAPYWQKKIN